METSSKSIIRAIVPMLLGLFSGAFTMILIVLAVRVADIAMEPPGITFTVILSTLVGGASAIGAIERLRM